jgi:hypothetical protein
MTDGRGYRRAIIACVLGVAMLAIGIGVASGAKLKTKSESTTLSADEQDTVTAKCKRGTKAVSGGFDADLEFDRNPLVVVYGSHRDGGRKWSASAYNAGGPDSGSLTSYAYCRDAKVRARSSETTLEGNETGSATARCPRGTKVFSGGFENPEFGESQDVAILPFESRKTGRREWTVSATNLADGDGTLVVHVYCREGKGLKTVEQDVFNDVEDTWELTPQCQRGKRVVSGGFDYTISIDGSDGPFIYSSHKVGKREWQVEGFNRNEAATFTAYAYCEKA